MFTKLFYSKKPVDKDYSQLFHELRTNGHIDDPNMMNDERKTPLQTVLEKYDAKNFNIVLIELLLERGADPNIPNEFNPIDFTIKNNTISSRDRIHILGLLLKHGGDPNEYWINPLVSAINNKSLSSQDRIDMLGLLLKHGGDPNKVYNNGIGPLELAVTQNNAEIVEFILKHKANPNALGLNKNFSLLALAVAQNNTEIAKLLLEHEANPNAFERNKSFSPLEIAVNQNNTEMVKLLLENKADPNAFELNKNFSPLEFAVKQNNTEMVKLLLDHKADSTKKNKEGYTPSKYVNENNREMKVLFMGEESRNYKSIFDIIKSGTLEDVKDFFNSKEKNASDETEKANSRDETGKSPLILALIKEKLDIANFLLKKGAIDPIYTMLWERRRLEGIYDRKKEREIYYPYSIEIESLKKDKENLMKDTEKLFLAINNIELEIAHRLNERGYPVNSANILFTTPIDELLAPRNHDVYASAIPSKKGGRKRRTNAKKNKTNRKKRKTNRKRRRNE